MVRRWFYLLSCVAGLTILSIPTIEAHSWERKVNRVIDRLVRIEQKVVPLGYQPATCTGWYIETYLVVTAAHCVDGVPEMKVVFPKKGKEDPDYTLEYYDKPMDIAILRVSESGHTLQLASRVAMGMPVVTIGYRGYYVYFFHGYVSSVQNRMFYTWPEGVLLDENFVRGLSGSPVINEHGNVVGLALGGGSFVTDLQTFGYVLPASYIHVALERAKS